MKYVRKIKPAVAAVLFIMSVLAFTGCQKKYEPVAVPGQESGAQEGTEENIQVPARETQARSSALNVDVTKETAPRFEAADETVYVTGNQVNLRIGCGPGAEVIARLDKGASLKRTGYSESWSKVIYQDRECYISSQYVSKTLPETEPAPSAPVSNGGKLIAIDAGHQSKGNSEKEPIGPGASAKKAKVASGTQGVSTGLPEYKLNLAVSLKLKAELESRGYQVYMIRETNDVNISNAERAEMANSSGADIFIRVHANSLSDSSVRGTLTMCQTSRNPYNGSLYKKSSALSKKVAAGVSAATGFKNRGVQETDDMSGINWCKIPVTIVEMGFMSNKEEDQKMATEEYQNKIAKGIADGIDAYYASGV